VLTRVLLAAAAVLAWAVPASAHPTPFSYVDIRLRDTHIDVTLSAHIVDVAHDLGLESPNLLLDGPAPPDTRTLLGELQRRLNLRMDDRQMTCRANVVPERFPATQTVRWSFACDAGTAGGTLSIDGPSFPYDPEHQTFVNLYADGVLRGQAVLDRAHRSASFHVGQTQSRLETLQRFLIAGIQHILTGPDHLLFLAGLLLAGGSVGRLATIVTAFTVAHSITLALAVLDIVAPPPGLIEPLIALSIVFVGLRNLGTSGSGEWRTITAGAFGLIHGFGFAYALREMQLPRSELGWSLLAFNLGVEVGQLAVVLVVALLFAALRRSGVITQRQLVVVGSVVVAAAGAFWFVERVVAVWR
jgi:hypothetical protein